MPKSWFTLGGSIVFLVTVVALYFSTEQQRTGERLQTSLQSLLPAVIASTSPAMDISANGDRWAMPSYQEQIAAWQAQQANITLDETDLATFQASTEADDATQLGMSDIDGSPQDKPQFITHLKQGLTSLGNRQAGSKALQPMVRSQFSGVSFQPSDQTSIERYANRQYLSENTPELQYLDSETIASLLSFRRILLEDVANTEATIVCRTETNGETGEESQTCIEVAPLGNRYTQYWIDDPKALWW